MQSLELAKVAAKALDSKKGKDIKILEVEDITVISEYFVLATGSSNTQVGALSDEVEEQLSKLGIEPRRIEGRQSRNWVLLDYGGVIVHVFHPEAREFYSLEHLWADAKPVAFESGE